MWRRFLEICVTVSALLLPAFPIAQHLVWGDTLEVFNIDSLSDNGKAWSWLKVTQQVDYSLTLSNLLFVNWAHEPASNQFLALQDFRYLCVFSDGKHAKIIQQFTHHLGVQCFFDSISQFQTDDNIWDTRFEWKFGEHHGCFVSSIFTSRLFNGYDYFLNDAGELVSVLNSSFLTPLVGTFSAGIQLKWPAFGSLNLGLSSAKLTWIRDKHIYEAQATSVFYGVPSDKKSLFEYGFSLQMLVDKKVARWMNWNCDLMLFKANEAPIDMTVRNLFSFRITRFLKASMQTRVIYEQQVSRKLQLENMVSVGFSFSL